MADGPSLVTDVALVADLTLPVTDVADDPVAHGPVTRGPCDPRPTVCHEE